MSDAGTVPASAASGPDAIAQRLSAALRAAAARRLAIDTVQAPIVWLHDRLSAVRQER